MESVEVVQEAGDLVANLLDKHSLGEVLQIVSQAHDELVVFMAMQSFKKNMSGSSTGKQTKISDFNGKRK